MLLTLWKGTNTSNTEWKRTATRSERWPAPFLKYLACAPGAWFIPRTLLFTRNLCPRTQIPHGQFPDRPLLAEAWTFQPPFTDSIGHALESIHQLDSSPYFVSRPRISTTFDRRVNLSPVLEQQQIYIHNLCHLNLRLCCYQDLMLQFAI